MSSLVNTYLPWLADLLEAGGPIVGVILTIAGIIWLLLFERLYYFRFVYPRVLHHAQQEWSGRSERTSWFAEQQRTHAVSTLGSALLKNHSLIATLIKVCPLLGLLGTVLGMLEVFDALAATGSNNPRSMAAGVSKATISTLAGMVVAIAALLANTLTERRAGAEKARLVTYFETTQERQG